MIRITSALFAALALLSLPAFSADETAANTAPAAKTEIATFAAGCYWCVESDFDKVPGVLDTTTGFMGGKTKNPSYEEVSTGTTGHYEAVRITYDPAVVSYDKLLNFYWHNVDLLDDGGQFCDRGSQYRPAIFVYSDDQRKLAEASKAEIEKSKRFDSPIVVPILAASELTPAHDQDFYKTNPVRYKFYRAGCGRDARLKQLWGNEAGH